MQGDHPITILFTDVQGSTQLRARHRLLADRDGPGDREAAAGLAVEVAAGNRDLGLPRHAAAADALRREIDTMPGEPADSGRPSTLGAWAVTSTEEAAAC